MTQSLTNVGVAAHGGVVNGGVAVVVRLVNVQHVLPEDAPDDVLASVETGVAQGRAAHGVAHVEVGSRLTTVQQRLKIHVRTCLYLLPKL